MQVPGSSQQPCSSQQSQPGPPHRAQAAPQQEVEEPHQRAVFKHLQQREVA